MAGPRKKRTYSKPLTRPKLAAAAIDIIRSEGQEALSMRKVAGCFGADVAALYRHFRNKDELLEEVARLAAELVDLEAPLREGSWRDRLLQLASEIRARIAQHPELGIYTSGSQWSTPFYARANGLIAALFEEAGLEGPRLVHATQTVLHIVTSMAQSEVMTRATSRETNRAFARQIREQLPEDVRKAWPATRAGNDWSVDFDALFDFALRSVLDGIRP